MNIKYKQCLFMLVVLLLGVKDLQAQIPISVGDVSTITDASEGDYYITGTNELYIGMSDGQLKPIGIVTLKGNATGDLLTWNTTTSRWEPSVSALQGWSLTGDAATTASNFLGTTDDVKMQIRSNNTPILELGRREILGLVQNFPDYTDINQPLAYLNGNGSVSALQFAASAATFYKPMFFTTTNGSFRLKGSSGGTDFFEIGSAGPANDGRLEFIIGDDGPEPIIFKRYDYRNGQFHKELFRVQGSNDSAEAKTRFGININPNAVLIDATYDDPQTAFNVANSTLQVDGSFSTAILKLETAGAFTLTEDHYTVIIASNSNLVLPAATSCKGRIYIIKNISGADKTTSINYKNNSNRDLNLINNNSTIWLQSDGTSWQELKASTPNIVTIISDYTLTIADNGKIIEVNSSIATTLTIPAGLPGGFQASVTQLGTGQITFSGAGGIGVANVKNAYNFTKTATQYSKAGIETTSTGIAILSGDLN